MQNLRRLLPSPSNLIVFEAAGRHASFTAAGRELGMSQAAVSYAIRGLEDQLGVLLFRRMHRRVTLTDAGRRFLDDVTLGLSHIRKSAENLREQASGGHVTLSVSTAFASFWMLPRLHKFREDLPEIDLRIQTSDRDIDLAEEEVALGIRGGSPADWPRYDNAMLAPERIQPVANAAFGKTHGNRLSPKDLTEQQLIHLEEPHRTAADWPTWFKSAGVQTAVAGRGLAINDYVLVIQAVLEGQGVALGWQHLTDRLIESGLLVHVCRHFLDTGKGFYVVWPAGSDMSPQAAKVRDWLIAQRQIQAGTQSLTTRLK